MKKYLSLILALALIFTLFAACSDNSSPVSSPGQSSEPAGDSQPPSSDAPAPAPDGPTEPAGDAPGGSDNGLSDVKITYPLTDEPVTLTYFQQFEAGLAGTLLSSLNDNLAFEAAGDATGVYIDSMDVTRESYQEKLNIMLASNDLTDLIYGMRLYYPKSLSGAIEEELIVDLEPYWKEYAPDFYNTVVENDFMRDVLSDDGSVGQFNSLEPGIHNPGYTGPFVRKDWLDDLGLDFPETVQEIHDMLVLFKTEKGASDAFFLGGTLSKQINACYDLTYLGASMEGSLEFFQKDGRVTISALEPTYKECVELYRDWYAEGLIYKDFAAMPAWGGEDIMEGYIVSGASGMYFGDAGYEGIASWKETAEDPDFDIQTFANPVLEKGVKNKVSLQGLWEVDANGTSVTTGCKDIELAMKYCNWWYTEEGSVTKSFGILGESYEMVDGTPQLTELITNNPDGYFQMQIMYKYGLMQQFGNSDPRKSFSNVKYPQVLEWPALWASNTTGEYNYPRFVTLTSEETEQIATKATDIATILSETILAVVIGEKPLEDIDSMIEKIKAMGIDEVLGVQQAAYDRYLARVE